MRAPIRGMFAKKKNLPVMGPFIFKGKHSISTAPAANRAASQVMRLTHGKSMASAASMRLHGGSMLLARLTHFSAIWH